MSFWQTKYWAKLLQQTEQVEKIIEINGILLEKRSLGFGKFGIFILGIDENTCLDEKKIIEVCKSEKALFVQIETFALEGNRHFNFVYFQEGYYKKFITPYTALIDLSQSEEEILSHMKPKGRYNIKLAEKKGIEVFEPQINDENIQIFFSLMQETTTRDNFKGNTFDYYKNFLQIIPGSCLIFTKLGDNFLSAGIFVFQKEGSIYYYGASTSKAELRNLMAPYLMQWYAIKKAKEMQSKYYDFLGVATPGDENSSLLGVTEFKSKFTSDMREVSKGYIFIQNKIWYFVFQMLRKWKNR